MKPQFRSINYRREIVSKRAQAILDAQAGDDLARKRRAELRAQFAQGSDQERAAVRIAMNGWGVDDIWRRTGLDKATAAILVTGRVK